MASKHVAVHQRVSGFFGDYLQGPTKRRRRQHLYGQVVQAEDAADQDEEEESALEAGEGNEEEKEAEDDAEVEQGESQEMVLDGMPGQLLSGDNLPKDYAAFKKADKDKIAAMVGMEVTATSRSMGSISWNAVASVDPMDLIPEKGSVGFES
jgi:hypothetical protein